MKTFSHVFESNEGMDKLSFLNDAMRMGLYGARSALLGTHGVKGWAPIAKKPLKSMWEGFKAFHPGKDAGLGSRIVGRGLQAMTVAQILGEATRDGTPGERIGRVAGNIIPLALMSPALGDKSPGILGHMVAQEALGGGMFVNKGLLERAGGKVDEWMGFKDKEPEKQPEKQTEPHQPRLPASYTKKVGE